MWYKQEADFNDLLALCWSGAKDRLYQVLRLGIEDEFMQVLEDVFGDNEQNPPELTEINDFIWFNGDDVIKDLCSSNGMDTDGNPLPEEEDE